MMNFYFLAAAQNQRNDVRKSAAKKPIHPIYAASRPVRIHYHPVFPIVSSPANRQKDHFK